MEYGLKMAILIKSNKYDTYIAKSINYRISRYEPYYGCASACVYPFLAGVRRYEDRGTFGNSELYFHQASNPVKGCLINPTERTNLKTYVALKDLIPDISLEIYHKNLSISCKKIGSLDNLGSVYKKIFNAIDN